MRTRCAFRLTRMALCRRPRLSQHAAKDHEERIVASAEVRLDAPFAGKRERGAKFGVG
jgi:hypothetical protein